MKKYLSILLSIMALDLGGQAFAQTAKVPCVSTTKTWSGSAGLDLSGVSVGGQKKKMGDVKMGFGSKSAFMPGASAEVNYAFGNKLYAGADASFGWINKSVKFDGSKITSENYKAVASAFGITDDLGFDDADISAFKTLLGDKKLLKKRIKHLFALGAHVGYEFCKKFKAQFGLGWAHLNAKYRKLDAKNDNNKLAWDSSSNIATSANVTKVDPTVKLWNALKPESVKKIKKNGFRISALGAYKVMNHCEVTLGMSYTTSVKVWTYGAGVRAVF